MHVYLARKVSEEEDISCRCEQWRLNSGGGLTRKGLLGPDHLSYLIWLAVRPHQPLR